MGQRPRVTLTPTTEEGARTVPSLSSSELTDWRNPHGSAGSPERHLNAPIAYRYPTLTIARCVNAVLWAGEVIKRAGSVDTEKLIRAWEGAKFKAVWGEVEMRACDHEMLTQGYFAEVVEPDIPPDLRHFGHEFPFLGKATVIARDEITVPPRETGNKRCA